MPNFISDLYRKIVLKSLRLIPDYIRGKWRLARILFFMIDRKGEFEVVNKSGQKFVIPNAIEPIGFSLLISGVYEENVLDLITKSSNPGSVVIDVGANIGCFVIPIADHLGQNGRIFAFEASKYVFKYLEKNISINNIKNAECINAAVSDNDNPMIFYDAAQHKYGMGSLGRIGQSFNGIKTTCHSLDNYFLDFGKDISVLKIDVEGFEILVLIGATNMLKCGKIKLIVFEFLDWAESQVPGHTCGDSQRFLVEMGYQIWRLNDYLEGKPSLTTILEVGGEMLVAKKPLPRN